MRLSHLILDEEEVVVRNVRDWACSVYAVPLLPPDGLKEVHDG